MRRLLAFIAVIVGIVIGIGVSFTPVATKTTSNIQYQSGHEFVYVMTNKDNPESEIAEGVVSTMADTMIQRLDISGISDYQVKTEGLDTIRVTLSEKNASLYEQTRELLSFSSDFSLCTQTEVCALASDIFKDSVAYMTFIYNIYPVTVIPVDVDSAAYKLVFDEAKKIAEEAGTGEDADTSKANLILWNDKTEEDTYEKYIAAQSDSEKCQDILEKVIMQFNFGSDGTDLYLPGYTDRLASTTLSTSSETAPTSSQLSSATATARWLVNLFNCTPLTFNNISYDVTFLFERGVDVVVPTIEPLLNTGFPNTTVAMSATLISFIVAFVLASLCLVLFYRLGAAAAVTLSTLVTFVTYVLLISFSAEFTIATVVGLIIVAIGSIASNIIYLQKLKEECYRGRSLKKVNSEASRRSTGPIIDISVVMVVCGFFFYLLGGVYLAPLGAALAIGGLANVIFNTFILKFLMWLATNSTNLQGKYSVFGVEDKHVPNVLLDEKQTYFGRFEKTDFTKKKTSLTVGIIGGVFMLASVVTMITLGTLTGGIYNTGKVNYSSNYYITTVNTSSAITGTADVKDILANIYVGEDLLAYSDVYTYDRVYINSDDIKNTYHYYVTNLSKNYTGEEISTYVVGGTVLLTDTLNNVLEYVVGIKDVNATSSLKMISAKNNPPQVTFAMVSSVVGLAVSGAYLFFRYRPSRGVSAILIGFAAAACTAGLFSITQIVTSTMAIVGITFVTVFGLFAFVMYANREKELRKELKVRKLTSDEKLDVMKRATSYAAAPILALTFTTALIVLNFFTVGPTQVLTLFIAIFFGVIVSAIFTLTLMGPLSFSLNSLLSRIHINLPKRKHKKKAVARQTSAEPEEAIFIGIND